MNDVQLFPSAPVIFAVIVLIAAIVGFIYGLSQLSQYNTFMGQVVVGFSQSAANQKVGLQVLTWSSAIVGLICIAALIWNFAKKSV